MYRGSKSTLRTWKPHGQARAMLLPTTSFLTGTLVFLPLPRLSLDMLEFYFSLVIRHRLRVNIAVDESIVPAKELDALMERFQVNLISIARQLDALSGHYAGMHAAATISIPTEITQPLSEVRLATSLPLALFHPTEESDDDWCMRKATPLILEAFSRVTGRQNVVASLRHSITRQKNFVLWQSSARTWDETCAYLSSQNSSGSLEWTDSLFGTPQAMVSISAESCHCDHSPLPAAVPHTPLVLDGEIFLYCFHYAGGSAGMFTNPRSAWQHIMPEVHACSRSTITQMT